MPRDIEGTVYLTITEAAQLLSLTPTTLRSWIRQGRLASERIGRAELIKENTLTPYQANRQSE